METKKKYEANFFSRIQARGDLSHQLWMEGNISDEDHLKILNELNQELFDYDDHMKQKRIDDLLDSIDL